VSFKAWSASKQSKEVTYVISANKDQIKKI